MSSGRRNKKSKSKLCSESYSIKRRQQERAFQAHYLKAAASGGGSLLAKWLSNKSFGEFAVGLASITIFLQIYTSFALEPMSVLGPSEYRDDLIPYLILSIR